MPLLAQLELLQPPPTLPSLPDPPTLQHALFENPIPPVILAIALGLAAYAVAARLDRRRLGLIGAAAGLALGGLLVLVSTLVQTKRERIQTATRALVAAVATADPVALDSLLADDARLYVRGSPSGWSKRAILDWIDSNLATGRTYALESHRVTEVQAEIRPGAHTARSRATVLVTPEDTSPTRFVSMLTWQASPDGGWTLTEIEPLWLQGWGEISSSAMREVPNR